MKSNFKRGLFVLIAITFVAILLNLKTGFSHLGFQDFFTETALHNVAQLRINRVLVMILAGIAIPTSGFLLQEYFQNPLAGPSVLGITSMASLSVALFIFLGELIVVSPLLENGLISFSAMIGSGLMMLILIAFSGKFKDKSFLIIFGFLISALAGALISVLQFYADNQSLKNYTIWSFGGNNLVSTQQIYVLTLLIVAGLFFSFRTIKPLIGNTLGENYALSLGVNLTQLKYLIIVSTSLLAASVTAFLGPILFIGIVVPHFCRLLYNPSQLWHQWILNMVVGVLLMQVFSITSELTQFPINVITSLFGIPVILLMLIQRK